MPRSLVDAGGVGMVFSGYRSIHIPLALSSELQNISSSTLTLGAMTPDEARELAGQPARDVQEPFEPGDEEFLVGLTGRLPFAIQMGARDLFLARREGWRGEEARGKASADFKVNTLHLFKKYWDGFDVVEKDIFAEIANGRAPAGELEPKVEDLAKYGFLEPSAGGWKISGKAFSEFIQGRIRTHRP